MTGTRSNDPAIQLREDIATFFRRLRAQRAEHMLTPSQLQALGHLERGGPMTASTLAALEQVTPQSISRTVALLEDAGTITRQANPADARASLISLTDHGRRMLSTDRERRTRWLADALEADCTEAEREVLFIAGRILRRLGTGEPRT
ncbi:MarR family transcriptional regulator [Rhodococcus spelaei]|uniref:MarR family transcriptional regulator n=1 Tax=Rhodococcus spelaei TaxID=2546320 RepID=A0A541BPJ1_9NOCA|nr:MarR family transcriptional regulator [Rhodococcus spelaei]TQF74231.1 MarR family transcriptional regulator [Rhodococcus spelaei]